MTTSFVHPHFPTRHPGVERAGRAIETAQRVARNFDGGRATATLLLAAIVSALLVVANQVVDTWTEGHLMAAWIVLWAVGFAALALFAAPARTAAKSLRAGLAQLKARRLQEQHDRQFWQAALHDARIMADISAAMDAAAMRDVKAYY